MSRNASGWMALIVLPLFSVHAWAQTDEAIFWQSISGSSDPAEVCAYLDAYPNGKFATLAKIRARKLGGDCAKGASAKPARPAVAKPEPPKAASSAPSTKTKSGMMSPDVAGAHSGAAAESYHSLHPISREDFDLAVADIKHRNQEIIDRIQERRPDQKLKFGVFATVDPEQVLSSIRQQRIAYGVNTDSCKGKQLSILSRIEVCKDCGLEALIIGYPHRNAVDKPGLPDGKARVGFHERIIRLMGYKGEFKYMQFGELHRWLCSGNMRYMIGIYPK